MSKCESILRKAKGLQLDECEVIFIDKKVTTIRITDSEIAETKQNEERGLAIRIIDKKKIFSARASISDDENNIFERALQAKSLIQPKTFWKSLPFASKYTKIEKTYDKRLEEISGPQAIDIANTMINSTTHKQITRISGSLNIVSEQFEIMNTHGLNCSEKTTYVAGSINADFVNGSDTISGVGAACSRTLDGFSPETIGSEASTMCINSINPTSVESDTYAIIFEPYAIGEMLAFVFASNFNLKTYSEKRSCFTDKVGKKISSNDFSLIDDPQSPEGIGSKPFDDEGIPTAPKYLIESGIFSNTFSDSFYAFKEGTEPSGNATRMGSPMGRDALPIPTPLPHNLRVKDGSMKKDEIVKETKKGLLVGRLWYTYPVNPERGDFSCTARSGIRIIENGQIKSPGKPVRIVHNLPILLQNISSVGNDSRNVLQWNALPCITPSVRVDSIKITPL